MHAQWNKLLAITGQGDFLETFWLAECCDFKEEDTAPQYLGTQLGVVANLMPKFELAGKYVKYSWAHANAFYQCMPLSRKQARL